MELDLCKQAIVANPDDYEAYYHLGKILAEQQKWGKAIAAYEKVIDLQSDFPEVYHDYGDALINLKRWQKAIKIYKQAIRFNPNFSWSYHNLGVAFFNIKKIPKALEAYSQALELDRDNPQFNYSLGQALKFKELWSEAALSYQQAIDLGWNKWQTYHEYGDILLNLARYNEAIANYQKAIQLNESSEWSYHNLGIALFNLELFTEAVPFFRQAIAINGKMADSYDYLGSIFSQEEKWDDAIASYRQADKLKCEFPDLKQKLALALQQRASSDLESALDIYLDALVRSDNQAGIYQNIANILFQQDKFAQALFYANEANKLQPDAAENLALVNFICQQRSKLYEPSFDFEIINHNYNLWYQSHCPDREKLRQLCWKVENLTATPLISIVLPVTASAITWIEDAIVAIQAQIYPYWELCLGIETSKTIQGNLLSENEESFLENILQSYQNSDLRIKVEICLTRTNLAAIANQAINLAQGDFIVLLQEKTLLSPDALLELVLQLAKDLTTDIIYADQDCLQKVMGTQGDGEMGRQKRSLNPNIQNLTPNTYILTKPWFKPDWNRDLFLSRNYFGSLVLCRHSLVQKLENFNSNYNYQYIYDLLLRLTEITENIVHIPKILSHHHLDRDSDYRRSRAAPANANHNISFAEAEKSQVIIEALQRRKEPGKVIRNPDFTEIQTIRYQIKELALVSIIILTRNLGEMLNQCLESIFRLTTYPNFEVIVVDNGSDEAGTIEIIENWSQKYPEKLSIIQLDVPFNYSFLNNQAVAQSRGKYLLFLNNDTKVISTDWIEAMVEQAQRKSIGAVGALLLYADDTVQHAGIVLGVTGIAGHSHRHFSLQDSGYYGALITPANYSAVTAACMMCRRETFEQVGGFNEQLAVAYNDVDLCLKLKQQGYHNIFLPHVHLYHYESQSRTKEDTLEQKQRIKQEVNYMETTWNKLINHDPGYSINLTREQEDFSFNLEPSAEVTAIFLSETQESELWGFFLDEPKAGCVKRNFLDIIGWVVGRIADAIAIEIISGNKVIVVTDIKETRPDVAQVYPQLPQAANSGFATTINILDLSQNAELILQVVLANETKVKLARIHLAFISNH